MNCVQHYQSLQQVSFFFFTLISACLVPFVQSHTDNICSLESSITHRNKPESWKHDNTTK